MTEGRNGTVRCELDGSIARIVLARPQAANAFDLAMGRAFAAAVETAAAEQVRAVLLTAEGERFCAGGDLAAMAAAPDRQAYLNGLALEIGQVLERLSGLDKPVIAAVQGAVAGAGMALVLSCDLVVCARSATFRMAYAGVGLTPDCGVSYLLPRAVGQQRALELALTGRALSAAEAHQWGLVTEVVDDERLAGHVVQLARRLASGPRFALGQAKRLIRSAWQTSRQAGYTDEAATIATAVTAQDATALIDAFLNRG